MSLQPFVELYRLCQGPKLGGESRLEGRADYLKSKQYIERIVASHPNHVVEIIVDGEEVNPTELPENGAQVQFTVALPAHSTARFYKDIPDLIRKAGTISRGEMPAEFYIMDADCYVHENSEEEPRELETLRRVCRLIGGLSHLAHYHDEKLRSGNLKLVFIRPSGGAEIKPVELETKVTETVLRAASELDIRLVEELSTTNALNDSHYSAKVGVFGTSLAEFISGASGDAFEYLIQNWSRFVRHYHRDLSTYLSGFAFHKAKVEVAEAELKIANEFSKVLNDILGKLLGIPVSFGAVLAIQKGDGVSKQILVVLGILVACLILSRVVANQQRQFKRIDSSKNIVIGAIEGKKESYPEDLKKEVDQLSRALGENSEFLRKTLNGFAVLSWLPFIVAVGYFLHLNCDSLLLCILSLSGALSVVFGI